MTMQPVMILAGGTGGHVFPALAVANELRDRGVPIIWVGTNKGIESRVVPEAGFSLAIMNVQGLRGKGLLQYIRAPLIIIKALFESLSIILKYKPCALLGMGGFVAGPCALIGVLLRKPLIIHEQNAIVGLTNRLLAPLSRIMFTGFPIQYNKQNLEYCGNPVRSKFMEIANPEQRMVDRSASKRLLIVGGSQGAVSLNKFIPQALEIISSSIRIEVWHQTGANRQEFVLENYQKNNLQARVDEFIDDIDQAYAWADLIVCRSGAITLAEVAAVGLGAVLIPYPYAVDDHQTANAQSYVDAGAAKLISEIEMTAEKLAETLQILLGDSQKLMDMACAAKKLGQSNASKRVADECMSACGCRIVGEQ
ncbi:MAG: undecaprenyldiphospho-muramoylpentapeptide beta-N-acetylglucosaminyltransferase [Gammaproteobacteria bacterium]|nr:undecaprenyldiphospho-muramoylpentapeptide beta-N-acetylglucosaminyltransferase [Gammaproteobacteria bacterium]